MLSDRPVSEHFSMLCLYLRKSPTPNFLRNEQWLSVPASLTALTLDHTETLLRRWWFTYRARSVTLWN